ncbi:unnamed protein product [Trichobilharzia szidati]|nr:unnamed protein product [Trichobilharzia szidati]
MYMNMLNLTMRLLLMLIVLLPVYTDSTDNSLYKDIQLDTTHSVIRPDIEISVIIMVCVVCCIVTVGIIGNVLVICVLTCNRKRMVYETFCVGLAVTDLIYLTMTSPITVMQYFLKSWIFGIFWCKVFNFIVQVTVFSSAFMLLGLTTSRFLAVVLPWQNLKTTEIQAKLVCVGAWLVGIIFALPIMIFQVLTPDPSYDDLLPHNITLLNTIPPIRIDNNSFYITDIPQYQTATIANFKEIPNNFITNNNNIITNNNNNENCNREVLCREKFPSQSSRTGYQLFVLLSTYVLPFTCILILNSCIVLKLKQKNVTERERNRFRRFSAHDSSLYARNSNTSNNPNNNNNNDKPTDNLDNRKASNTSNKLTWLKNKRKRHTDKNQENLEINMLDNVNENCSSHRHHYNNNNNNNNNTQNQQQQNLEQQISNDTVTSNMTSPASPGYRETGSVITTANNLPENISSNNPNELVRATRELKKKRLRSKATKLVVLVTTLWGVCWLPTHIINSWFFFDEASFPFIPAMKIAKLISQTLSFAASCVNPIVYSILTGSFKTALSNRFRKRNRHDRTKTELYYISE